MVRLNPHAASLFPSAPRLRPDDSCHDQPEIEPGSAIREPVFQQDAAARSHMGEVADAEGWGHSTSTEAFPGVRRRRRERPRRPFAAVEPVEHFHQRRDRPDVALGDELASSALNLAKANPRLRPLHLVVRETEFCGLRLAGYFRRRMRENSRNSVRRPRCASLTRRNYGGFCLPGNRPGLSGLHGGARRNRTDDLFNAIEGLHGGARGIRTVNLSPMVREFLEVQRPRRLAPSPIRDLLHRRLQPFLSPP